MDLRCRNSLHTIGGKSGIAVATRWRMVDAVTVRLECGKPVWVRPALGGVGCGGGQCGAALRPTSDGWAR